MTSRESMRLARTADRWGTTPSRMLAIRDEVTAFLVDEALATRLELAEFRERLAAMGRPKDDDLLPDERYEDPSDVED